MNEKKTTDLLNIFDDVKVKDLDKFIQDNQKSLPDKNLFFTYLAENNITTAQIVNACIGHISKSYIHELLNGKKNNPSRDIVIIICIAAHMNRKMTRRVLENYEHRDLYLKDKRDIIIATFINNEIFDIDKINDELNKYALPLLNS